MAIDTRLRRYSAVLPGCPWRVGRPFPDGNVTAEDRHALAFLYSGLVGTDPVLLDQIGNIAVPFDTGEYEFDLSIYFSGQTSYAIAPAVEVGWTFDANTGLLTIDTDDANTFGPYTITASNGTGDVDSNPFTVSVLASAGRPFRGLGRGGGLRRWFFY